MENLGRLTVKEWQRERGASKKRRTRCWRSVASKNHPEEYPGAERLRGACLLRGWYFGPLGVFLAVPLPLFSEERGRDCRAATPGEDPHQPPSS